MIRILPAALIASLVVPAAGRAESSHIVQWSFQGGKDGEEPFATLLPASDGSLYGTTVAGGTAANGTVFNLVPAHGKVDGKETTIWTFTGGSDGAMPLTGLLSDSSGALYGTTSIDGDNGRGTVFRLDPPAAGSTSWTETTLWSFAGQQDGGQPSGTLIADNSGSGVLYGVARFGGAHGLGVVYSLTPPPAGQSAWIETVLFSFTGTNTGARPQGALLQDSAGVLYGVTTSGGSSNAGIVYSLKPPATPGGTWSQNVIWTFTAGADGATPLGALVQDSAGALYGTASYGGQNSCPAGSWPYYGEPPSVTEPTLTAPYVTPGENQCGVVFKLTPPAPGTGQWTQSVLWNFTGDVDGDNPVSELLLQPGGILYGTTPMIASGAKKGVLYKLTPPSQDGGSYTETSLQTFAHEKLGSYPRSGVALGTDGKLYGTMPFGGDTWVHVQVYGYGVVFRSNP